MDEHAKHLICRVVDGCATPEEEEELKRLAEENERVREELELQREAAEAVDSIGLRELRDELSEAYMANVLNRLERRGGWALFIIGSVLVLGYTIYEILTEPGLHTVYRVGLAALIAGTGLLISSAWRQKAKLSRHDKYTEVIR